MEAKKEKFAGFIPPPDLQEGQGDWKENYPDYLGQCHSLDENVGRLVDTLKELGMWDNTILFYTSDHGSHFCTRNGEYKRSCHEASIHIPLIAAGGPFSGGKKIENMVSLIDLPFTMLDCAGIKPPEDFQGRSLKLLMENEKAAWDECVFLQISESQVGRAIRTKRWKYSVRAEADGWNTAAADTYYEEFLYDLEADPWEQQNLADNPLYGDIRAQLADKLKDSMEKAGEQRPVILPYRRW